MNGATLRIRDDASTPGSVVLLIRIVAMSCDAARVESHGSWAGAALRP